jgi:rhamnose transport system substrate-binding protein
MHQMKNRVQAAGAMLQVKRWLLAAALVLLAATLAGCAKKDAEPGKPARTRIGVVAKSLGNGFFDAVNRGAQDAARELDAEIIFTGPTTPTAEGQIEVLKALIAQRVDAIVVSANDPDALVPQLKRAMERGIKVVSYDSAVAPAGRVVHLAPSSDELIGETVVALVAELSPQVDGRAQGKFAVVSATPTSTNQNSWLAQMRIALQQHPGLEMVSVVYGDDVSDKSNREAVALIKQHPDLAVLVSISSVGIVASARAVEDQGLTGKIKVTGLGLPSELQSYVQKGVVPKFAIWNPIDLGYAATHVAVGLVRGGDPKQPVSAGRMGSITFGADGVGAMAKPFIYDANNVADFAKIF